MSGRAPLCATALVALSGAWASSLSSTESAYTASGTTGLNVFSGAADWAAPTLGGAAVGRTTAYDTGEIMPGSSYYAYANLTDSGSPASGLGSVSADVSSVSSTHTTVPLSPGSFSAGGQSYNYRSAPQTAATHLSPGVYAFPITATDNAGNAGTQSLTAVLDTATPTATDVQSANVAGGTVGHLDQGDTLTLSFNETLDPFSILPGWTGGATGAIQVALVDGGGNGSDFLQIFTTDATPAYVPLGTIDLNSSGYLKTGQYSFVTFGGQGASRSTTMTRNGASIALTLGSPSGPSSTSTAPAAMTLSPFGPATDVAGNVVSTASATQSGAVHLNF